MKHNCIKNLFRFPLEYEENEPFIVEPDGIKPKTYYEQVVNHSYGLTFDNRFYYSYYFEDDCGSFCDYNSRVQEPEAMVKEYET